MKSELINLDDPKLQLAIGGGRVVYQHPKVSTSVIKVLRLEAQKTTTLQRLRPSVRRYGYLREWYVEYAHYIASLNRGERCPEYLPRFLGFTDTTLGIGQIFEKISNEGSSDIAPTLSDLIALGNFDREELEEAVIRLFEALKRDRVVLRDVQTRNLCVVHHANGKIASLVVVDGLGDFTVIPIRRFFTAAYDIWHTKAEQKVLKQIADSP